MNKPIGEIKNALITAVSLGSKDHGILTAWIFTESNSGSQGFGGYALDTYNKKQERRIGTAWGCEFILRVLETLGVEKWEDLKGEHCRIDSELAEINGIGHIIEDKWFYPADLEKMMKGDENHG